MLGLQARRFSFCGTRSGETFEERREMSNERKEKRRRTQEGRLRETQA
ncbi:MAG: hypothetical protein J2P41_03170 [Blastocatellia bacterium]|nr:hypothetical protein [Blastocatellia bacterium]